MSSYYVGVYAKMLCDTLFGHGVENTCPMEALYILGDK